MPLKKKRSPRQQAQAAENLAAISLRKQENLPPPETFVPAALLASALDQNDVEHARGDDYQRRWTNEARKEKRSRARAENLRAEVVTAKRAVTDFQKDIQAVKDKLANVEEDKTRLYNRNEKLKLQKDALRKTKERVPVRIALVEKKEHQKAKTHHLREHGTFSEACRDLVREMVSCGVPVDRVNDVIHTVCGAFDIDVPDSISARSVGRIVTEGGVAAQMQLGYEMGQAPRE